MIIDLTAAQTAWIAAADKRYREQLASGKPTTIQKIIASMTPEDHARIKAHREARMRAGKAAPPPPTSCAETQVPPVVPPSATSTKAPSGVAGLVTMASSNSLLNGLNRPSDSEKALWAKVIKETNARI